MVTKEIWLKERDSEELPMFIWFEYYKENGGTIADITAFENAFASILSTINIVPRPGNVVKELSFNSAIRRIHSFYNKKFEVDA